MGDQEAKKVLSQWIKKENENRYLIARPLEMSENLFTFLQLDSFYLQRGKGYDNQIQQFKEELQLFGFTSYSQYQLQDDHTRFYWK